MRGETRELWVEIGALTLFLGGLFFLILAGLQLAPLVASRLLTGSDQIEVRPGIFFGWKEQAVAVVALAMPGVFLIMGASTLRFWLGSQETPS